MTDIKETIQGLYALKTYLASKAIDEQGTVRESLIEMQKVVDSAINLLKEQEADNLLDLDTKTLETLTIYADEQCFTLKEAIVNLIEYGLKDAYGNDVLS